MQINLKNSWVFFGGGGGGGVPIHCKIEERPINYDISHEWQRRTKRPLLMIVQQMCALWMQPGLVLSCVIVFYAVSDYLHFQ